LIKYTGVLKGRTHRTIVNY